MPKAYRLPFASPESQGIASSSILNFIETIEQQLDEVHSFILVRHGQIVAEAYWSPYGRDITHSMFSLSKSFTSTAVGLAIAEGFFGLDDFLIEHFPDDLPASVSPMLAKMRVRHLLSMATGHEVDTLPYLISRPDGNWSKAFFEVPVLREPGSHFVYNTGASYMLSALVHKTTGQNLTEFLEPRLYRPLGIKKYRWDKCPRGIDVGGMGLNITTRDIASFGQLYLQKGLWAGKQLLPESWVKTATSFQVSNGDDPLSDWAQGYGFQFWRCRHNAYRGDGAFGQYCIVMPEHDAVLAMTSGLGDMQEPLNLVWDCLLPALQAKALPENPTDQSLLNEKIASLHRNPIEGNKHSPMAQAVSGVDYVFPANPQGLQSMRFDFAEDACTIRMKVEGRSESIVCGYGEWQAGKTHLFKPQPFSPKHGVMSSGGWQNEKLFQFVMRLYETPFIVHYDCQFEGDSLQLKAKINVSFDPNRVFRFTGTKQTKS